MKKDEIEKIINECTDGDLLDFLIEIKNELAKRKWIEIIKKREKEMNNKKENFDIKDKNICYFGFGVQPKERTWI